MLHLHEHPVQQRVVSLDLEGTSGGQKCQMARWCHGALSGYSREVSNGDMAAVVDKERPPHCELLRQRIESPLKSHGPCGECSIRSRRAAWRVGVSTCSPGVSKQDAGWTDSLAEALGGAREME